MGAQITPEQYVYGAGQGIDDGSLFSLASVEVREEARKLFAKLDIADNDYQNQEWGQPWNFGIDVELSQTVAEFFLV